MNRRAWIGIVCVLTLAACLPARANVDWTDPTVTFGTVIINGEEVDFQKAGVAVTLAGACNYDWWYGCSPTSGGMLLGLYDRKLFWGGQTYYNLMPGGKAEQNSFGGGGGLDFNNDPNPDLKCNKAIASSGHIADFWGVNAALPWHTFDSIADFMGTSQDAYGQADGWSTWWSRTDGLKTYPSNIIGWGHVGNDIMYGMYDYVNYRGYGSGNPNTDTNFFSQKTDNKHANGFTFEEYIAQIDAGKPVMVHVEGHTMCGYGYDADLNRVYVYDTWNDNDGAGSHTDGQNPGYFTWGGSYNGMELRGVTCANLTGGNPMFVLKLPPWWWWRQHPLTRSFRWDMKVPQWDAMPYDQAIPAPQNPQEGGQGVQQGTGAYKGGEVTYSEQHEAWGVEGPDQQGQIYIDIENDFDPIMTKEVFLQFRMLQEGEVTCDIHLNAPGTITGGNWELVDQDGEWDVWSIYWEIFPQPDFEQIIFDIIIGSAGGGVWIESIDVGTNCPEPATMCLLALGGLAVLRRRRRAA